MFGDTKAFSGFSVDDIDAARTFYRDTLGLTVEDNAMGFLNIHLDGPADAAARLVREIQSGSYGHSDALAGKPLRVRRCAARDAGARAGHRGNLQRPRRGASHGGTSVPAAGRAGGERGDRLRTGGPGR